MSLPRRRLIRPAPLPAPNADHGRQVQKLRERLTHERTALAKWQTKLRRAFNSVEKIQRRVLRLEQRISVLEE